MVDQTKKNKRKAFTIDNKNKKTFHERQKFRTG